jgi:hypothetical protein
MATPAMFVCAPDFRIAVAAESEWTSGLDLGVPTLRAVLRSAFEGTCLVVAGPKRVRAGADVWKVVLDVPGVRAELKVRCDVAGRWKVLIGAWGVRT